MNQSSTSSPSRLNPKLMAGVYDQFVAARWRGEDETADSFAVWFERHWTADAPPEPDDPPEAASVLGGAGSGIRWYARDDVVLGYVGGQHEGCYAVSVADAVPPLRAPWERQPMPVVDDHVLHVAGFSQGDQGQPGQARQSRDPMPSSQGTATPPATMPWLGRPSHGAQSVGGGAPLPGALIIETIAERGAAER